MKTLHLALSHALQGHTGWYVDIGGKRIANLLVALRADIRSSRPITTTFQSMQEDNTCCNGLHLPETNIVTFLEALTKPAFVKATTRRTCDTRHLVRYANGSKSLKQSWHKRAVSEHVIYIYASIVFYIFYAFTIKTTRDGICSFSAPSLHHIPLSVAPTYNFSVSMGLAFDIHLVN